MTDSENILCRPFSTSMRLGILSDAHGNVDAFRLGLQILTEAGAEVVYFLGDAVGYIPDAGVVGLLQKSNIRAIRGNHDDMLIREVATVEQDAIYRHRETSAALKPAEREFLRTLPLKTEFHGDGVAGLFVHGSPTDPLTGYIYPDSALSEFSEIGADVVFMGHTHHPFVRQFNRKLFVNVGSCGLPRGQDLRGSVCIFDVAERHAQIIKFDISKCCERILSQYSLSPPVTSLLSRCVQYTGSSGLEE
jgi:predicted phosphodiesterase